MIQFVGRWLSKLSLWPRIALPVSVGFLILFATFSALGEHALEHNTSQLMEEHLIVAQMAAGQIDGLLRRAVAELKVVQGLVHFDSTGLNLVLEANVSNHPGCGMDLFASSFAILDPAGQVILSCPSGLYPPGTDLSGLPPVTQALLHPEETISEPFRDPLNNYPVMAVNLPIYQNQHFAGLLWGLLDLSDPAFVQPLERAAGLGRSGHATLVDRRGRVLVSTLGLPFLSPSEHITFSRAALVQAQPVVKMVPFDLAIPDEPKDDPDVLAVVPLDNVPWGVALEDDLVGETFAEIRQLRLRLTLLGVIALTGVWVITLVGTRRLMRPIHQLTRAARRIAQGDIHTPLQPLGGGEVGAMGVALENMRSQLSANIETLAHWNNSLEDRVAEQTETIRQQQVQTQRLLKRAITAQEDERTRLSRELHDSVGQMLVAVELNQHSLLRSLSRKDEVAHNRLKRTREIIAQIQADLHRIMAALRPAVLDELGLVPALAWMSNHTLRPLGLTVTIEADEGQGRLPGEIETILFRIAQEAMGNAVRHSQADQVTIRLFPEDGQVIMILSDNGQGFDMAEVTPTWDRTSGLGLASMQERASLAGGQVTVESVSGQGTTVRVEMPYIELDDPINSNLVEPEEVSPGPLNSHF